MNAHLYMGNRNYSSWSLRPWLALSWAEIAFTESVIELDQPGYGSNQIAAVLAVSPTGKVPALRVDGQIIYDSLAISEWAAENTRAAPLLPADSVQRARVRSAVCEMHSGFAALRRDLTMNIRRRCKAYGLPPETLSDIARVDQLFVEARREHAAQGPYLFGARSLADAFYAPVATRFRTYAIALSSEAQAYCDVLLNDAAFLLWEQRVLAEPQMPFTRANHDALYP